MKSLKRMNIEHQQAKFAQSPFGGRSLTGNPNAKRTTLTRDSVRAMKMGVRKPRKRGGFLQSFNESFNQGLSRAININLIQGLSGMN